MEESIIGRGWTLPTRSQPVHVNEQGKLISLTNRKNEIEQAIGIILMTAPGERVMRPEFGCRIHDLVFAPNNFDTAVQAQRFVTEALNRWEPRITVDEVVAQPAHAASQMRRGGKQPALSDRDSTLLVYISYTIKATRDERSLVYPFYLIPGE